MGGTEDPRSNAMDILDWSVAGPPPGTQQVRCRWDVGYFAGSLAIACMVSGVDFAIEA